MKSILAKFLTSDLKKSMVESWAIPFMASCELGLLWINITENRMCLGTSDRRLTYLLTHGAERFLRSCQLCSH
jgi:hypothetical protein